MPGPGYQQLHCPSCHQLLLQATSVCTNCGLPQAARLADLIRRLDHTRYAADHAVAELNQYLAERRAAALPQQQVPAAATDRPVRAYAQQQQFVPQQQPSVHYPQSAPVRSGTHRTRRQARRLSPQATLLALGVLLLLAAGTTFLAVKWNTLPLGAQAAIMGTLAVAAFAAAVLAGRRRLAGTAEALGVLGTGLLAVDLYAARVKGLVPTDLIGDQSYAALACAVLAGTGLLMHRVAPRVLTFGLLAVLAAQAPVPVALTGRVDVAVLLAALLAQAVATLALSRKAAPRPVRITGVVCALTGYAVVVGGASLRALTGSLEIEPLELWQTLAAAGVAVLAAITSSALLRLGRLTGPVRRGTEEYRAGQSMSAAIAAAAVASAIGAAPVAGAGWLVLALIAIVALVELLVTPGARRPVLRSMVVTGLLVLAGYESIHCLEDQDGGRFAALSLLTGALALVALWRGRLPAPAAVAIAFAAPVIAAWSATADGVVSGRTSALVTALLAAAAVGCAGWRHGHHEEPAALVPGAVALVSAFGFAASDWTLAGVGLVLAIGGAPLLAYGRLPGRRIALIPAVALLASANAFGMIDAGYETVELYTVPTAVLMLLAGLLGWHRSSSWVSTGPGLLLGLLPSALIANADDTGTPWRLALVVAAAVAVVLTGVATRTQAPFMIGASTLALIGCWQFADVVPLIPRWVTLGLAGAILLAAGATYEQRIAQAKRAARWVADLT